jgi:AcrR family transcriptional regulator
MNRVVTAARERTPKSKATSPAKQGADTRNKLLDAAERLFGDMGYERSSLRDIAESANVTLGLTSYHFGTKEKLLDEVVGRRALTLESLRIKALDDLDIEKMSTEEAMRKLIEAYVKPMLSLTFGASRQFQAFSRLMSQLNNVKRWTPLFNKYFDRCSYLYIDSIKLIIPEVEEEDIFGAFSLMIAMMGYVCSRTNRFGLKVSQPADRKAQLRAETDRLIDFVHAGFMALQRDAISERKADKIKHIQTI